MKRLTPAQAIKAECRDCMGGQYITCTSDLCMLGGSPMVVRPATPLKRIKAHCQYCAPDMDVDECEISDCPLYPYRYGKNPYKSKAMKEAYRKHPQMRTANLNLTGVKANLRG